MKVVCRLVEGPASGDWGRRQLSVNHNAGCMLEFSGQVRANNNQRNDVVALHYQAYPEMFAAEVQKIATEMQGQFELIALAVEHSVGEITLGQDAVHVVVSAAHRRDTFAALEFFMMQLKQRVPIFKKEIYSNGEQWLGQQD
jgi:molybdopterin synthase catalytic subunit